MTNRSHFKRKTSIARVLELVAGIGWNTSSPCDTYLTGLTKASIEFNSVHNVEKHGRNMSNAGKKLLQYVASKDFRTYLMR